MRDSCPPGPAPVPPDWGTAFAAMPLETPPADGWSRLSKALPQPQRSRARYWVPAALAASLAMLMLWPRHPGDADRTAPAVVAQTPAVSPDTQTPPAPLIAETPVEKPPVITASGNDVIAPDTTQATAHRVASADSTRASSTSHTARKPHAVPRDTAPAAAVITDDATQLVDATPAPATPARAPSLESLYAESAQLEALLAQVSDERVASGTAMALSAELHDRVARIDVALSQPDLDSGERVGLWRERVAALQRLTGVAGTQRWMAANGYRADGEVARVY